MIGKKEQSAPSGKRYARHWQFPLGVFVCFLTMAAPGPGIQFAAQPAADQKPSRIEFQDEDGKLQWRVLPTFVEIESLLPKINASAGKPELQNMASFGPGWGGAAQMFWRPPAPVEAPIKNWPYIGFTLPVPQPGRYRLSLLYTVAPDYGKFRIFINGKPATDVDGYASKVAFRQVDMGELKSDSSGFNFIITVFGKNDQSTGYCMGLDRIKLEVVE